MSLRSLRVARPFAALLLLALCLPSLAAIVVRDDTGRAVRLEAPARRIVSLAPHITELLFDIDAGDAIVAATEYSDYPEAAKRLPSVGGLGGIALERIVALKPDLVIAWQSGTAQAQLDALVRLRIPVFRSEPHTLTDVATTLERLGTLTGHAREASAKAYDFRHKVAALRATYASRAPVRVFHQVWNNPLMTIGGPHLITSVIELCGGRNVFASVGMLAPTIDAEAVIAADPQLIVTALENGDRRNDVAQWSRWTSVSAVRHHRYLFLDPAVITRHTPRILIGAETLCRAIDAARADST
ncbi:MAG: cobalamin-binding protein [Burkholderiaceae bacterium]